MAEILACMVTWRMYGTWFDRRGEARPVKKNAASTRVKSIEYARFMQKQPTVRLTRRERDIVKEAIVRGAARTGEEILAIAVHSNHVHIVLRHNGRAVERSVSRLKNAGYFALREDGLARRVWARGYDKRYCFDEEALRARIGHVEGHGE
jgi:REP element-mobilizing transposase RayT